LADGKEHGFELDRALDSDEPPRLPAAPGVSRVDTLSEDFLRFLSRRPYAIGDVIAGRYKLIETLGDGAMGQVFVAENLSIGRRVAIKMLKPELLADAQFRKRFQQEAQAIAVIEHRNVARFFDLVVGDPTFLVMEFVPGPTLAYVLRSGRMELTRAINIVLRLCWALDAAHRAGVIHRDIKPSNVILSPDPEHGEEPKLIDFGLAKLASTLSGEGLTRTGQILGTPEYMSPEQIANRDVDARSDVYSLGCVLYEMLTGAPPFGGSDDVQILYQQVHAPAAPARRQLPELPREVDALIARAIAKQPRDRFASMQEMATALAHIDRRRGGPSSGDRNPHAAAPPRGYVAFGWALALGIAGALAGGGGVWLGGRRPAGGGALLVTSQPSGAVVEVDGQRWRETTPTAVAPLRAGTHQLRVSAPGHGSSDETVTIGRAARTAVSLVLPPVTRTLTVQSIPAGASVFVDGHPEHKHTPVTVAVIADDFHEVRVELDGYETETRALKPENQEPTLMVHLEPERMDRGTIWVDGPATTQVWMDGAPIGSFAPTVGLPIVAGAHAIELHGEDGELLAKKMVTVKRGEVLHVTLQLGRR
jgi:serine/threonine-protein kinase